jgi:hypothetical protein
VGNQLHMSFMSVIRLHEPVRSDTLHSCTTCYLLVDVAKASASHAYTLMQKATRLRYRAFSVGLAGVPSTHLLLRSYDIPEKY